MGMTISVFFLGFGEAAQNFCTDKNLAAVACGYDIKLNQADAAAKAAEFQAAGVTCLDSLSAVPDNVCVVLSLVTADQALAAAKAAAAHLPKGALFMDMNSVAATTKQEIAQLLAARHIDYVDVAIMAPIRPKQLNVPLFIAGAKADKAQNNLQALGFDNMRIVGAQVGRASCIKMLRSVMTKGMEALTIECALAAQKAGIVEDVFGSMSHDGCDDWLARADYNLNRMMVHGARRAAEMNEVVKTLESLDVPPVMSQAAAQWQSTIGALGCNPPPETVLTKLNVLGDVLKEAMQEASK